MVKNNNQITLWLLWSATTAMTPGMTPTMMTTTETTMTTMMTTILKTVRHISQEESDAIKQKLDAMDAAEADATNETLPESITEG